MGVEVGRAWVVVVVVGKGCDTGKGWGYLLLSNLLFLVSDWGEGWGEG